MESKSTRRRTDEVCLIRDIFLHKWINNDEVLQMIVLKQEAAISAQFLIVEYEK